MTTTAHATDNHDAARAAWEAATGRPMGAVDYPRTDDLHETPEAAPEGMGWVWADEPTHTRDGWTIATATAGVPGYRYWHGTPGAWRLIAAAADETESATWYAHRVTPEPAPADVAAWLDGLAAWLDSAESGR